MTRIGLAAKLTADTGKPVDEDQAQELIDLFYASYPDFADWQEEAIKRYMEDGETIKLPCGWRLFPDNDNFRSAANAPIQGFGACVMRKAVEFCHEAGLKVIFTLHDAVYIEYDSNDLSAIDTLRDCMHRAFVHYFDNKEDAGIIRLDGKCWSPDYEDDSELITPKGLAIDCSKIFVDERAGSEYEQFSGYFEDSGADLL